MPAGSVWVWDRRVNEDVYTRKVQCMHNKDKEDGQDMEPGVGIDEEVCTEGRTELAAGYMLQLADTGLAVG